MPSPVAPKVPWTIRQRTCREQLLRRQSSPPRLGRRAKMLLALVTGAWAPTLEQLEAAAGSAKALDAMIVAALTDPPRPGPPATATAALGEQANRGMVQSMPTRAACVRNASHRLRFLSTPQPSSWLPQSSLWGSMVVRRLLQRGNCTAVADFRERLLAFIAYVNKTMAKPFTWT